MVYKKENLVHLGIGHRPHGIKGGFQFKLFNVENSVLKNNSEVILYPSTKSKINPNGEKHTIQSIHFGNKVICYLKEIKDRNLVEEMLTFDIYYPRDMFPDLEEEEVYLNDLVGMSVVNMNGERIGEVALLYDNGAQTVLKIRLKNRSIELPFVSQFFPKVDKENKTIQLLEPEIIE